MKRWKKFLAAVTAGVLCVGSVGAVLSVSAYMPSFYDEIYGDLYYSATDDGEIEILGCNEDVVSVEIPAEIDGRPVTAIDINTFIGCKSLKKITISDSVTSIGGCAFSGCESLTEIIIPNSVTSIGSYAFSGTPWLAAKQEENPLVVVNGILLDGTTCTGSITIPDGVTSIGDDAFVLCENLTGVTIPDSVASIGKSAFEYCENLTEITIPYGVISIEESAFYSCTSLTEIKIPNSVTNIGPNAFDYCTKLTNIAIPNSVTSIGDGAFSGCKSLTEITIPDSVESIGAAAFEDCENLSIYGYTGSYAETYANESDIPFVSLGYVTTTEPITTTTTETTTTAITTPTGSEGSPIYGDINLDGRIDITDAVLLNKHCAGSIEMNADALQNADCDGDKEIGNNDAIVLLKFLVQLVPTLPYSE